MDLLMQGKKIPILFIWTYIVCLKCLLSLLCIAVNVHMKHQNWGGKGVKSV